MKYLTIFSILMVASITFAGEIKKEFDVSAGQRLEMDIKTGGSIYIYGENHDKVVVVVSHRGSKLNENVWVDMDDNSRGVEISAGADGNTNSDLEFKVYVPLKFDIEVTTMGGEIVVANVEGKLEGETMGGEITLEKLKGSVKFSTMGGDVELTDSDVDGKISTMGGEVLFKNIIGDVDGSSMGGNVIYKNVRSRNGKSTGKEVNISTMGGKIKVDEAFSGADVSTMGGDIDVNKAKLYIKANTMGGDIDIRDIDGWVKATTMGGDVDVTMTGDPSKGDRHVEISSMGGDIELVLPDGISADFDIRITYTRNSNKNYEINSDFSLDIEEDDEWSYNNGDPRKKIEGTGKSGDGEHSIKVSTINGNITIKKN
ncbi:MAG: hypothetical protein D8M58_00855 [Calditrichaeota bacterium]|nr:MAG: hypothetical protein DWQ03_06225 [Calditrichota bacterium]MBL1203916.1 hypothetical protein [Calditrichota bacterium]NOG43749.1 DUF4097 family beta strand repeat protein [Calditrichota bacterium]